MCIRDRWVLKILRKHGLADGQSVCIDATTLQANAGMKSLVRRDTGQAYEDYLRQLAQSEGIENASKEQLARLDRRRKKKASNDDWTSPNDPSARITKMKDGRTKLAYKAEHAVDLASGALLAVTVQPADRGDTTSYAETLDAAQQEARKSHPAGIEEVVLDKGYHSGAVLMDLAEREIRSYVPEPERGQRHWSGKADEQRCVYANRQRVRGKRSKRLQKLRGELCERSFAHCYETGAMRRIYVRGTDNTLKRVLVQAAAFNIGLLLRTLSGWGKPRQTQGRMSRLLALRFVVSAIYIVCTAVSDWLGRLRSQLSQQLSATPARRAGLQLRVSATGCYSENATVTEYYDVIQEQDGETVLVVTTVVEDPVFLVDPYILSSQYKKQKDSNGWDPTPCSATW